MIMLFFLLFVQKAMPVFWGDISKMDKSKFLEAQYVSIREEIRETKARIFRLAGYGLVGIPSAYLFAEKYQIQIITYSLPILICTLVLIFMSESRALMRAGRYIRCCIEPVFYPPANSKAKDIACEYSIDIGWENWLEEQQSGEPGRRLVDKLLAGFFYTLFFIYYIASVFMASSVARSEYGTLGMSIALGFYIGIGTIFCAILFWNFRHSTSTCA